MELPALDSSETLALLRPVLAEARPTDANIIPLLAVLAYPEFVEVAGDVECLLVQAEEAEVQRHGLDTLIAMRSPGLFDVLVRLSRASRWPEIRGRASRCLAAATDFETLVGLPRVLRHVAYRAAVLCDVRFPRERFRQCARDMSIYCRNRLCRARRLPPNPLGADDGRTPRRRKRSAWPMPPRNARRWRPSELSPASRAQTKV